MNNAKNQVFASQHHAQLTRFLCFNEQIPLQKDQQHHLDVFIMIYLRSQKDLRLSVSFHQQDDRSHRLEFNLFLFGTFYFLTEKHYQKMEATD